MSSPASIRHVEFFIDALFAEYRTYHVQFHFLQWDRARWNGKDDIDILVDPLSLHLAVALCASVAERFNIAIVSETKSDRHHHVFMAMLYEDDRPAVGIHMDFQVAITEGGFCFADAQQFLGPLQQESAHETARLHEAILIFVRAVAGKGYFKPGYWERIETAYQSSPVTFGDLLTRYYGRSLGEDMCRAIRENDMDRALQLRPVLFKWAKVYQRQTKKPLINRAASRIARLFSPKGIWIGVTSQPGGKHHADFESFLDLITLPVFSREYVRVANQVALAGRSGKGNSLESSSITHYIRNIHPVTSRNRIAVSFCETADGSRCGPNLLVSFDTHIAVTDIRSAGCKPIGELGQDSNPITSLVGLFKTVASAKRRKMYAGTPIFRILTKKRGPLIISVVGMDGSGKGTYISKLLADFSARGLDSKVIYLGYANYKKPLIQKIERARHGHPNRHARRMLAILFLLLLPWEFRARAKDQKCEVLITDRHPVYEPVAEGWVASIYEHLFRRLLPAPDVVLYLTGDTETLWKRKEEYAFDSYKKKSIILKNRVKINMRRYSTVAIDTTQEIQHTFKAILESLAIDIACLPKN